MSSLSGNGLFDENKGDTDEAAPVAHLERDSVRIARPGLIGLA